LQWYANFDHSPLNKLNNLNYLRPFMTTKTQMQWLGHSAFRMVSPDGHIIYIDPFLSQNPSTPKELKKVEETNFIFLTHGHEDHVGDTLEIAAKTGCRVGGMVELMGLLQLEGLPEANSIDFNKGGSVHFDDFSVTMVHANHSSSYKGAYAGEAAGLIFSFENDICVYHMGDTNIFGDLQLYGELYEPDVVLAPIGDHYTMGPEEAAYAVQLIDPSLAIPIHYGTWEAIASDPVEFKYFVEEDEGIQVIIPAIGASIF